MAQVYKPIYTLLESFTNAQEATFATTLAGKPGGYSQIYNSELGVVRIWDGIAFTNNAANPLYLYSSNNLSDLTDVSQAKTNLALNNVDNTSDANKPVSTAQATAINAKQNTLVSATNIKTINGASVLGSGDLVVTGSGAAWGDITGTLSDQTDLQSALAAKAPIASPIFTGTVGGITKTMVALGNVDNTSDANKPVSTAQATADTNTLNSANAYTDAGLATKQNSLGFTAENVANKQTDLTASATKYPTVNAVNTGLATKQDSLGFTAENVANKQTDLTASATKYPTVNAVNTGLATKQDSLGFTAENVANKQTDLTASATKYPTVNAVNTGLGTKQDTLVSATNIKTINGSTILGSGDLVVTGSGLTQAQVQTVSFLKT